MRYKIILSNSKEKITIQEDEIDKVLKGINQGSVVIVREGIFNPSYFVCIVQDKEREKQIADSLRDLKRKFEEPSIFAKLLNKEMPQFASHKQIAEISEEVSKEERKLKH